MKLFLRKILRNGVPRAALLTSAALAVVSMGKAQTLAPSLAKPTGKPSTNPVATSSLDPTKSPLLYVVTYSHLDTEWCWTYRDSIREYIPNTLKENFLLFEKYPNYVFNWTGANRYRFVKDYYPADYARLKQYVAAGRWIPTGSAWDENDAIVPSSESIIRSVLYSNRWFQREFGKTSNQYMMPDTFGFPASLPTILAHCGLKGFSTKKLTYGAGAAVGVPFNVGRWIGPDGQSIIAALNPGDYRTRITEDLSQSQSWLTRLQENGKRSGIFADYMYHGNGDLGGSPGEKSAAWLETSLLGTGPVKVVAGGADDFFTALTPERTIGLPEYRGDLLLIQHSAGSINSGAAMKRWNHRNERLADAAERASVSAHLLNKSPYPTERLTDAWERFLGGQMHDILPGTSIPQAYELAWNDQIVALNQFADVTQQGVGQIAVRMDTRAQGIPLVVYNPLSIEREDVVTATVTFPSPAPERVRVFGPNGKEVPAQLQSRTENQATILFLARVPSVGCVTFDVRASDRSQVPLSSPLRITRQELENARYRIHLDATGDVDSILDKTEKRQMLSAPLRLAFLHEKPQQHPAWNMDWSDRQQPPLGYVDGPVTVKVLENGPARVALQVERQARGSHFAQIIRISAGTAGERIEFQTNVDWRTTESSLKAVFPLTVANPKATYNEEVGVVERGNNDPKKYEVPAHDWFDLTGINEDYGVSVLNEAKYGSDKPDDKTLRLTLLYTPGIRDRFQYQATQDWGHHEIMYALQGHRGDWRTGRTPEQAARLNQPLLVFQTKPHSGQLGHSFSLLKINQTGVMVAALKKAEDSDEVIVRLFEQEGKAVSRARLITATPIVRVREVNGQEQQITPDGKAQIQAGSLLFDMKPYRPRAFALTLKQLARTSPAVPKQVSHSLPFDQNTTGLDKGHSDIAFASDGTSYPIERLPDSVESGGVTFRLLKTTSSPNAVACAGQRLEMPATHQTGERYLYLLAAAADGDVVAPFELVASGNRRVSVPLTIQNWEGFVGQWDTRIWKGEVQQSASWPNELAEVRPGYIKRDPIAWYCDHRQLANGEKDAYHFCYLYRYALRLPKDVKSVIFPQNPRIHIFAATITVQPSDTQLAYPLYDVLNGQP